MITTIKDSFKLRSGLSLFLLAGALVAALFVVAATVWGGYVPPTLS